MLANATVSGEAEICKKKTTVFAKSTFNDRWWTGLDKIGTENTKRSEWSGQYLLGQIIVKVAQKMRKRISQCDNWRKFLINVALNGYIFSLIKIYRNFSNTYSVSLQSIV